MTNQWATATPGFLLILVWPTISRIVVQIRDPQSPV